LPGAGCRFCASWANRAAGDDSKWETVEGKDLGARRSAGHVAFLWYRALLTMPAQVAGLDLSKPTQVVFNVLVDDYGEVWVNGQMPRRSGYPSPATIQGLNMPNRVVLGTQGVLSMSGIRS
jgi:gluconolactonase